MTGPTDSSARLTAAGCRTRIDRLREQLHRDHLDAALIVDRRHVHYFTGYWAAAVFTPVLLVIREAEAILAVPTPPDPDTVEAIEQIRLAPAQRLATLVDDPLGCSLTAIAADLARLSRIGWDVPVDPFWQPHARWSDLRPALWKMRRAKFPDELALMQRAIAATEAAYRWAAANLRPGLTEVDLFAGMQAAAAAEAGEVLGEFGNDFQIGSPGGPPRRRAAEAGEVAVFDLSVTVRGYRSDMCRSFVVGGAPSPAQEAAHRAILEVLHGIADSVRPGVSCRAVYESARDKLDGYRGWAFPHHLGHGIGLSAHEAPRLNPHWDDRFAVGDLFTVEPGLYAPELRAGLRIEEIFHLTPTGIEQLTTFPTTLG